VVRLKVLRGSEWYTADVTMTERPHDLDRLSDLVDPDKSLIEKLGVLAIDVSSANESLASGLRVPVGVMVAGHTRSDIDSADAGLMTADTIHAVNGIPVASVDRLRAQLDALKPHAPVVLQIERNGQFVFLAFELD
jgi:S1-C subfamily serine protease